MKIIGVRRVEHQYKRDERGWLLEAYRTDLHRLPCLQMKAQKSAPGSVRGSHVHRSHWDLFLVPVGRMLVGLRDVRKKSPTFGATAVEEVKAEGASLLVPPGVAHFLFFTEESMLITVDTEPFDRGEEAKVNWADPELGIDLDFGDHVIPPPEKLSTFKDLMAKIESWQEQFALELPW